MEQPKDRKLNAVLIVLIAIAGFTVSLISLFWRQNSGMTVFVFIEESVYYLFVFYYAVWGYKIPHGNLLRYLMLLLAVVTAVSIHQMLLDYPELPWPVLLSSNVAAVLIGYMAGRLHKVKKNIIVVAIVTILLLIRCFWPIKQQYSALSVFSVLDRSTTLFTWITIMAIYFFRYKEHKEAGLLTDEKDTQNDR